MTLGGLAAIALAAGAAQAQAAPRVSLTDIEDEVMCVACHTPLAVSESPQANSERDFIRSLIAKGQTKSQIKSELVAQYGPSVLALPRAHGFNLTVYILPPLVVAIRLGMLALSLPRWRRRARAAEAAEAAASTSHTLAEPDAKRLDEELARYDG
jgi:cytochrome c-type biogenesis protein CcmH/NrfF